MFWTFDKFGWLTGTSEVLGDNCTAIAPPVKVPEGLTPAFRGRDWILLNKDHYMASHYPELHAVSIVITGCRVDDEHSTHPDLELAWEDGAITVPSGATISVHFELRQLDEVVRVDKKWRVPVQALDVFGGPNGSARWVFARVALGVGTIVYKTREGESEKILFNEATINSGLKAEEQLVMPQPLVVYSME